MEAFSFDIPSRHELFCMHACSIVTLLEKAAPTATEQRCVCTVSTVKSVFKAECACKIWPHEAWAQPGRSRFEAGKSKKE